MLEGSTMSGWLYKMPKRKAELNANTNLAGLVKHFAVGSGSWSKRYVLALELCRWAMGATWAVKEHLVAWQLKREMDGSVADPALSARAAMPPWRCTRTQTASALQTKRPMC